MRHPRSTLPRPRSRRMTPCYGEPLEIVGGEGRRAIDAQGRRYLDFFAGSRTNSLGYDIPEIADAISRQLAKAELLTATAYLNRSEVELAERIARLSGIPDAKVCFVQSGTEANELALMPACGYRHGIVTREPGTASVPRPDHPWGAPSARWANVSSQVAYHRPNHG